jgi:hypothetical protein
MTQPFRNTDLSGILSSNNKRQPAEKDVNDLHTHSDVDHTGLSQHHTLGPNANQASPGDHSHDGGQSGKVAFTDISYSKPTVSGSRGGNAALQDLLLKLEAAGLIVNSTSA